MERALAPGSTAAEVRDRSSSLRSWTWFFPVPGPDARSSLASETELRAFLPHQTVTTKGEDVPVRLVVDGQVAVRRTTLDGHEVIPRIVSRGQLEPFLPIAGRPASAETLALSPGRVAVQARRIQE